jgi:curved DNA-binding protein CbpA
MSQSKKKSNNEAPHGLSWFQERAHDKYAILGLTLETFDEVVMKKAYKELMLLYHPDKMAKDATDAMKGEYQAIFNIVREAKDTLSDKGTRAIHNELLLRRKKGPSAPPSSSSGNPASNSRPKGDFSSYQQEGHTSYKDESVSDLEARLQELLRTMAEQKKVDKERREQEKLDTERLAQEERARQEDQMAECARQMQDSEEAHAKEMERMKREMAEHQAEEMQRREKMKRDEGESRERKRQEDEARKEREKQEREKREQKRQHEREKQHAPWPPEDFRGGPGFSGGPSVGGFGFNSGGPGFSVGGPSFGGGAGFSGGPPGFTVGGPPGFTGGGQPSSGEGPRNTVHPAGPGSVFNHSMSKPRGCVLHVRHESHGRWVLCQMTSLQALQRDIAIKFKVKKVLSIQHVLGVDGLKVDIVDDGDVELLETQFDSKSHYLIFVNETKF